MSEFTGEAGTIYVNVSRDKNNNPVNRHFEVWFEDFCILGTGNAELEALRAARRQAFAIGGLITEAIEKTIAATTVGAGGGGQR